VYAALDIGLDVYDAASTEKVAYITYPTGFNSVWANTDRVYLATGDAGIKYLKISSVDNAPVVSGGYDISISLRNFLNEPTITNSNVLYLHGSGNYMACCTVAGVDTIRTDSNGYINSTNVSGAQKCFMTSVGKFYYTINSNNQWSINRVDISLFDWSIPDYQYITGSGIFPSDVDINDIFITEGTSSDSINNTIFSATTSGAYIIDEGDLSYSSYFIA
jgi:hypothetical protein